MSRDALNRKACGRAQLLPESRTLWWTQHRGDGELDRYLITMKWAECAKVLKEVSRYLYFCNRVIYEYLLSIDDVAKYIDFLFA